MMYERKSFSVPARGSFSKKPSCETCEHYRETYALTYCDKCMGFSQYKRMENTKKIDNSNFD